jgi:1-deoxy-D-xylulose-5-phosphate synthase
MTTSGRSQKCGCRGGLFEPPRHEPSLRESAQKRGEISEWIGGKTARKLAHKAEAGLKSLLAPSVIFDDLGIRYYGPVDGHDIPLLTQTFEFLKNQNEPVILHVLTQKGKGYAPALEKPDKFHGLGKFHLDTGETIASPTPTYSEILGTKLADFADDNNKIIAITAAMPTGTGLINFAKRHPERCYDVGIAEEHAALFAAGMATKGMKPFLAIYSTFMQRAYDMIIHDIALQNLNVALCLDRAGLSGDDGPTHHGLFDIAYLRPVPGIIHMQPKDEAEFADMLWTMTNHDGPSAIRYPRGTGTGAVAPKKPKLLEIGKSEVLRHGSKAAIFALGNMCEIALEAAAALEAEGVSTAVINARWIKPLDTATLEFFASGCDVLLHHGGPRSRQRLWLVRDRTPLRPPHHHTCRAHRLARPICRTRHCANTSRQAWFDSGSRCSKNPRCPSTRNEKIGFSHTSGLVPVAQHAVT